MISILIGVALLAVAAFAPKLVFAAVLLALYFTPALVARHRQHQSGPAIAVLNLLLGWTVLGWIAALVWSLSGVWPAEGRN
jgi:hypothetical protein